MCVYAEHDFRVQPPMLGGTDGSFRPFLQLFFWYVAGFRHDFVFSRRNSVALLLKNDFLTV